MFESYAFFIACVASFKEERVSQYLQLFEYDCDKSSYGYGKP